MLVMGFDPSLFSMILPSEQRAGEQRDAIPLPRAWWMWSAVAARQSCFLQHSAAIV